MLEAFAFSRRRWEKVAEGRMRASSITDSLFNEHQAQLCRG
jgi:hypothetical protein